MATVFCDLRHGRRVRSRLQYCRQLGPGSQTCHTLQQLSPMVSWHGKDTRCASCFNSAALYSLTTAHECTFERPIHRTPVPLTMLTVRSGETAPLKCCRSHEMPCSGTRTEQKTACDEVCCVRKTSHVSTGGSIKDLVGAPLLQHQRFHLMHRSMPLRGCRRLPASANFGSFNLLLLRSELLCPASWH